jgi:hypothetical protein
VPGTSGWGTRRASSRSDLLGLAVPQMDPIADLERFAGRVLDGLGRTGDRLRSRPLTKAAGSSPRGFRRKPQGGPGGDKNK